MLKTNVTAGCNSGGRVESTQRRDLKNNTMGSWSKLLRIEKEAQVIKTKKKTTNKIPLHL